MIIAPTSTQPFLSSKLLLTTMNTVRYMKLRIGLNCHPTGGFVCGCNASDRGYNLIDSHENPAYLATGAANFRAGMGLRGPQAASLKDDDLIPRWSIQRDFDQRCCGRRANESLLPGRKRELLMEHFDRQVDLGNKRPAWT